MAEVEPDRGSFLQRNLIVIMVFAMIALVPMFWLDNTTQLFPDHSEVVMKSALATGFVSAIGCALLIVIVKPASRSSTTVTAIAFFFCGLIFGTLLGMFVVDEAFQFVDFSGPHVTRKLEDFAIDRAYKTHGKNGCCNIQLRDYFGDFCINSKEYKSVFSDSEDTRSTGYCLRADTERNGSAIRIMHSSSWSFRPGSIVRCSVTR